MRRKPLTSEEIAEAVRAHAEGESMSSIARRIGAGLGAVMRALRSSGVPATEWRVAGFKLSNEDKDAAVSRYEMGESANEIARTLGVSGVAIANLLRDRKTSRRSHQDACRKLAINEAVLDDPNEEGRYWIGFLMADGCVVKDKRHDSWQVVLVASEKDAAHVEAFKAFLQTDAPIQQRPASRSHQFPQGHFSASKPHVRLSVSSKRLAESLGRFGIVPRKSLTAQVIGLESCPHFWRGAVDGDGFVSWHQNPSGRIPIVGLYGSHQLVAQFYAFVLTYCPALKAVPARKETISSLRITGLHALELLRVLYADARIALARKSTAAQEAISEYGSKLTARKAAVADHPMCVVSGCGRETQSRTSALCSVHLKRMARHGSTDSLRPRKAATPILCSTAGCERIAKCCGLCVNHYGQQQRANNPIPSLTPSESAHDSA